MRSPSPASSPWTSLDVETMWRRHKSVLGVHRDAYLSYFEQRELPRGIQIDRVWNAKPMTLPARRRRFDGFFPPQLHVLAGPVVAAPCVARLTCGLMLTLSVRSTRMNRDRTHHHEGAVGLRLVRRARRRARSADGRFGTGVHRRYSAQRAVGSSPLGHVDGPISSPGSMLPSGRSSRRRRRSRRCGRRSIHGSDSNPGPCSFARTSPVHRARASTTYETAPDSRGRGIKISPRTCPIGQRVLCNVMRCPRLHLAARLSRGR